MRIRFGPLDPVITDPLVTDVAITVDGRVWTDRGLGMERDPRVPDFRSPRSVREFAVGLCAQLGSRLDDACPIADATSSDGIRVNAVIAPVVPDGASVSIRIQPNTAPGLDDLAARGMMPDSWTVLLRRMVASRANILIVGATGSGKTTLMRALLRECAAGERVVSVEEVRELGDIGVDNHVALAVRKANVEGAGEVGMEDLVRASLRMRPDRIVVGECRGSEMAELVRALNSGHRGGMTTIHANGIEAVASRLVALGLLAGMSPQTVAMMAHEAFDVIIHVGRLSGVRRVRGLGRLSCHAGILSSHSVAWWDPGDASGPRYGPDWGEFSRLCLFADPACAPDDVEEGTSGC